MISTYLLNISSSPSSSQSPDPIFQATSALIDIYSDENLPYDVNFRQGNYLDSLVGSLGNVKKAVKSVNRKKEGGRALRARGEEVLELRYQHM